MPFVKANMEKEKRELEALLSGSEEARRAYEAFREKMARRQRKHAEREEERRISDERC